MTNEKGRSADGIVKAPEGVTRRLQEAMCLHRQESLVAAARLYEEILELSPDHPDALHFLGLLRWQRGHREAGLGLVKEAVRLRPRVASFQTNLGNLLSESGDATGARDAYLAALALEPDDLPTRFNLGLLELREGRLADAEQAFRAVLRLNPQDPDARCKLGRVLRQSGRSEEAITVLRNLLRKCPSHTDAALELTRALDAAPESGEPLQRALDRNPRDPRLLVALGNVRLKEARPADAETAYRRALEIEPGNRIARLNLAAVLGRNGRVEEALKIIGPAFQSGPVDSVLRARLCELLGQVDSARGFPWIEPALHALLEEDALYHQPLVAAAADWLFSRHPEWAGEDDSEDGLAASLYSEPVLCALLERTLAADARLERLVRRARAYLLRRWHESDAPGPTELALAHAVALQCLTNEHLIEAAAEETSKIEGVVLPALSRALGAGRRDLQTAYMLCLVCAYRDPVRYLGSGEAGASDESAWPDAVRPLVRRALVDPVTEHCLEDSITSLGPPTDAVSRKVAAQYEGSPYPRWVNLPRNSGGEFGAGFGQGSSGPAIPSGKIRSLLVAGCGTGQEPIALALSSPNLRIVALDLSRPSLAYALRRAGEFGVADRIRFVHGDVLDAGHLGERFDAVSAVGVLHHMAEPATGLRRLGEILETGGLMRIGLYSRTARMPVVAARRLAAAEGLEGHRPAHVRRLRHLVFEAPAGTPLHSLLQSEDFYSLSTCRDLLFHVHETDFDLDEVVALVRDCGLCPVGLEIPGLVTGRLAAAGEAVPGVADFESWSRIEQRHPDIFAGMYRLWCSKPGRTSAT